MAHHRRHRHNPEGGKMPWGWLLGGGAVLLLLSKSGSGGGITGLLSGLLPGGGPSPSGGGGTASFAIPGIASLQATIGNLVPQVATNIIPTTETLGVPVGGVTTNSPVMTTVTPMGVVSRAGKSSTGNMVTVPPASSVPFPAINLTEDQAAAYYYALLPKGSEYTPNHLPWVRQGMSFSQWQRSATLSRVQNSNALTQMILSGQISQLEAFQALVQPSDDLGRPLGHGSEGPGSNPNSDPAVQAATIIDTQAMSPLQGLTLWVNDTTGARQVVTGWPYIAPGTIPPWRLAEAAETAAYVNAMTNPPGPNGPRYQYFGEFNAQTAAALASPQYAAAGALFNT